MGFDSIVLLSVVEIFGDFNLRWYAGSNQISYLYYGLLGYAGVIYFLIQSLRDDNVLYVNGMWDGLSGIVGSLAAYVVLGDRLKTSYNYIGLLMIIVGVGLLRHE